MTAHTSLKDWCEPIGAFQYVTVKPVPWELGREGSGLWYVVPENTVFDVSIPYGLRWLLNPHDPKFLKAAALHDSMLTEGWDRPSAGGAFHAALSASGVGLVTRLAMFFAVTLWKWR